MDRLADSWYNGGNVEGKKRQFMVYVRGFPRFAKSRADAVAAGYRGLVRR